MKKVLPIVIGLVVIGAVVAAVIAKQHNSSTPSTTTTPTSSSAGSAASSTQPVSTNSVSIKDLMFSPESITVKKGTTVTWTNQDNTSHTITADSGTGPDSGTLANGKSYSFTYDTAGTFAYHCNFHSDMHGTVVVTE